MTDTDWPHELVTSIGREVQRWRKVRKVSAQKVAAETKARGFEIKRSVLANLESGRRTSVSVPELLILADVLNVPPAILLFPVGYKDAVEVFPQTAAKPYLAIGWFIGERSAPTDDSRWPQAPADSPLGMWRDHIGLVTEFGSLHAVLAKPHEPADELLQQRHDLLGASLLRLRAAMRAAEMTPPKLDPILARSIGEAVDD